MLTVKFIYKHRQHLVLVTCDVRVFDFVEFALELPNFFAVSVHLLIGCVPVLVELVDHQGGVAICLEPLDAELYRDAKAVDAGLCWRCLTHIL